MAEMMNMFHSAPSITQTKSKLRLTRPKGPVFETSQRVRPVKIKSSAEIEEEMMAKVPKFKARPVNKKILEAPSLAAPQRSTPCLPEFHEFHLKTMERANQNAKASSIVSTKSAPQNQQGKPHLRAPKSPVLQTTLRARPLKIKSSEELEKEELEKAPKFKARPLNKKIFESKGEPGRYCNPKRQLSNSSDSYCGKRIPKNTAPNPFHLRTEERGAEKEKKFVLEIVQKQIKEEKARVPKATPYPYTTDYPVIPPKPEPKHCTKPEPFQLESVARHEEEMQREMEERQRKEKEEAEMRKFKAHPVLKEDPIPVPEKVRKPLTEVQGFNLHVDHRAVDRSEFDKKIKEKEMMYKRYGDEAETSRMMEEEKALEQLRRTLVPRARPVPFFMSRKGDYSTREGYLWSLERNLGEKRDLISQMIWKAKIPKRLRLFIWRLNAKVLPTRNNLRMKDWYVDTICPSCDHWEEDELHCFITCPLASSVWFAILEISVDMCPVQHMEDWLGFFSDTMKGEVIGGFNVTLLASIALFQIWKARNDSWSNPQTKNEKFRVARIADDIKEHYKEIKEIWCL